MATDAFSSSDSGRSPQPLTHARTVSFGAPLALERGGVLPQVALCYETYGTLTPAADNAVLICHALSGDSHVARHDATDAPGWWDIAVGPGKPLDTDKYFIICANVLGGCRGSTGPNSINPQTDAPYGPDFPVITIGDIVETQRRLIEHLGIARLRAVIGGSMGGHQALTWGVRAPERVAGVVAIATSPRLNSQSLAFDIVGRNAIMHDPNFHGGHYYSKGTVPNVGLAIARMIGHITYLSDEAMQAKFEADRYQPRDVPTTFEKAFSVGSYLGYQGDKFVERFDANSYLALSRAMDLFDLGRTHEDLTRAFAGSTCRWLVLSFTSDWLFPPHGSQAMVNALIANDKPVSYCNIASSCGHDAFLLPDDLPAYGGLMAGFLDTLGGDEPRAHGTCDCTTDAAPATGKTSAVSIFQPDRLDYSRILDLIPEGASVLDLGCGRGELLCRLGCRGHRKLMGLELDADAILHGVRNGQNVIHADLNRNLPQFATAQFDVVVLSQTLQAVLDVEGLLGEMVRVGRRAIVSFPNFAYDKLRRMLAEAGRAPESTGILRHRWYNTPNLRFFSITDFTELCHEKSLRIHRMIALDTEAGREVANDPNRNADMAIVVLSR